MKSSVIKAFVVAFSVGAVGVLAITPSRAQSSSGSSGGGMGGCCGMQSPSSSSGSSQNSAPTITCGPGTMVSGTSCVKREDPK